MWSYRIRRPLYDVGVRYSYSAFRPPFTSTPTLTLLPFADSNRTISNTPTTPVSTNERTESLDGSNTNKSSFNPAAPSMLITSNGLNTSISDSISPPHRAISKPIRLADLGTDLYEKLEPARLDPTRLTDAVESIRTSHLSALSIDALQYLFVSLYLIDKRCFYSTPQLVNGQLGPARSVDGMTNIHSILTGSSLQRQNDSMKSRWASWGSRAKSLAIRQESPLARLMTREFQQIDAILTSYKSHHLQPSMNGICSTVQYLWNICIALRQSGLIDVCEFSNDLNRDHGHSWSGLTKVGFMRLNFHQLYFPLDGPDRDMKGSFISRYQPIIVNELFRLIQKHIDLIIFPTVEVDEPSFKQSKGCSGNNSTNISTSPSSLTPSSLADPIASDSLTSLGMGSTLLTTSFDAPFPSSRPISNILRLTSLIHSIRHVYNGAHLIRTLATIGLFAPSQLVQIRQQRSHQPSNDIVAHSRKINMRPLAKLQETDQQCKQLYEKNPLSVVYLSDSCLMDASLPDAIYLLQLLSIYKNHLSGISVLIGLVQFYLSTHQIAIGSDASLRQLFQLMESLGEFQTIEDETMKHIIEAIIRQSRLDKAKFNTSINHSLADPLGRLAPSIPTFFPPISHVARQKVNGDLAASASSQSFSSSPSSSHQLAPTVLTCLTRAFSSFAECALPKRLPETTKSARWYEWEWTHAQNTIQRAPIQMARMLCKYYSLTLVDSDAPFYASEHEFTLFRENVIQFAWSLIAIEMEQYDWTTLFLQRLVEWFQHHHTVTKTADGSFSLSCLVRRLSLDGSTSFDSAPIFMIHTKLPTSLVHKLHQISIAIQYRSQLPVNGFDHNNLDYLGQSEKTQIKISGLHGSDGVISSSSLPLPSTLQNFQPTWCEYFHSQRSSGLGSVSPFAYEIYSVLSDPNGPFAFRRRSLQQNEQQLNQDNIDHQRYQHCGRRVDFFVEYVTNIGYTVDAAIFDYQLNYPHMLPESKLSGFTLSSSSPISNRSPPSPPAAGSTVASTAASRSSSLLTPPIALEMDGPSHYRSSNSSIINARTRLRRKQLRLSGWRLICYPTNRWNRVQTKSKEEQIDWLLKPFPSHILKQARIAEAETVTKKAN